MKTSIPVQGINVGLMNHTRRSVRFWLSSPGGQLHDLAPCGHRSVWPGPELMNCILTSFYITETVVMQIRWERINGLRVLLGPVS